MVGRHIQPARQTVGEGGVCAEGGNTKNNLDTSGSSQAPITLTRKKKIIAEPVFDVSGLNKDESIETLQEPGIKSSQDKTIDESVNNSKQEWRSGWPNLIRHR